MTPDSEQLLGVGLLILSDRCFKGECADASGPALQAFLQDKNTRIIDRKILPDTLTLITDELRSWVSDPDMDVILTCGGTGVSPRDVTPEATREVLERELPGFGELMRTVGLGQTPRAIISRALAGTCGQTLIVNLPGRPEAAVQSLEALWPAIPHALAKLQGSSENCFPPSG